MSMSRSGSFRELHRRVGKTELGCRECKQVENRNMFKELLPGHVDQL